MIVKALANHIFPLKTDKITNKTSYFIAIIIMHHSLPAQTLLQHCGMQQTEMQRPHRAPEIIEMHYSALNTETYITTAGMCMSIMHSKPSKSSWRG